MNVEFGLNLNKKDVLTIVLLCVVFFSIAVVNLGYTAYPTTVTNWTAGQSFYVNLGVQTNVKSVMFLLHVGALNVTVSTGSPGNWTSAASNADFTYSSGSWSEDYYKWDEVTVAQTTQYFKVDIGYVRLIFGDSPIPDRCHKPKQQRSYNSNNHQRRAGKPAGSQPYQRPKHGSLPCRLHGKHVF